MTLFFRFILLSIFLAFSNPVFPWGQTGHRIVGEIAQNFLSKKADKNVRLVLDGQSLAMVSNYMDFIKSDASYKSYGPWHYSTIPDSLSYAQAGTPEEGDIISAMEIFIAEIQTGVYQKDEGFALMCLVHLVGDVHQPLHVGNGKDKGGNDIKVKFFSKETNLHRVWDSNMIDELGMSYSEFAGSLTDTVSTQSVAKWQKSSRLDWALESKKFRDQAYEFPEHGNLSYQYMFDHTDLLNLRLLQAGIRLAGLLNELYD